MGFFQFLGKQTGLFKEELTISFCFEPPEEIRLMKRTSLLPKKNFLLVVPRANAFFFIYLFFFRRESTRTSIAP